ncbi:MAG: undecaprenyl-phosphate glucose phosphotransferase [Deltaproteobacteria bacterium]|nr:undecaprenyl-phosphate glucose phosphotransferase [Deltaproteobacteria bacterium]
MLKRYSEVYRSLLILADLLLVSGSWVAAYLARRHADLGAPADAMTFRPYGEMLLLILPIWLLIYRARGIYRPWRTGTLAHEAAAIAGANTVGVVVLMAASFFVRSYFFSRGVLVFFYLFATGSVIGLRLVLRLGLRGARRRGYNLRHVLVAGAGELAQTVIERFHAHPETGLRVAGVLSADGAMRGREVYGVPVLGGYGDLKRLLAEQRPDLLVVALPASETHHLEKVLADLDDEVVNVRVVPDLPRMMTLRAQVEDLDGLPLISLREGPLVGWAAVQKRAFDVVVSAAVLALASPLLALLALAVRLTAGSPVLFVQERMGLDGRVFRMFKFRTMVRNAEGSTGPVWTVPDDERRTRLGAVLRRLSLDELPQLWNVLRGDMSLVGPRPERPVFIEQFRREIPGYMLRHKIKAGLTGWAQIHGWRGNTSLHERVEHDLYYIQNWSLALDVKILLLTAWRGLVHRNAY